MNPDERSAEGPVYEWLGFLLTLFCLLLGDDFAELVKDPLGVSSLSSLSREDPNGIVDDLSYLVSSSVSANCPR